jgi:serine/threonine-protein kinase PpkA
MDWGPYQGRVIILITDAGPLPIDDEFNTIPGDPSYIADKAARKNIKIVTLHLKTPDGKNNHLSAEQAYKELSFHGEGQAAYLDIKTSGDPAGIQKFSQSTNNLVSGLDNILFNDISRGPDLPKTNDSAADLGALLGYSIKLDYLGVLNKTTSPSVVKAWIADKDLAGLDSQNPRYIPTTEISVLLTKNQLSFLKQFLTTVLYETESDSNTQSRDLFENILLASSQFAKDPDLKITPSTKIADIGTKVNDFLSGLPYKSMVMTLTKEDWYNMGPIEQDKFIRRIKSILSSYNSYDSDLSNWAKYSGANDQDWLYKVPLSRLP